MVIGHKDVIMREITVLLCDAVLNYFVKVKVKVLQDENGGKSH